MASPRPAHTTNDTALAQIVSLASGNRVQNLPYSGDVTPQEAFDYISAHDGIIVDVRTLPEWQFTGVPDVQKLLTISWKTYPDFATNPKFAEQLAAAASVTTDTPLFFLCRSGGRSLDAALAMSAGGYHYCFNIAGGFEGGQDHTGHRGNTEGWKAAGLPWKQG